MNTLLKQDNFTQPLVVMVDTFRRSGLSSIYWSNYTHKKYNSNASSCKKFLHVTFDCGFSMWRLGQSTRVIAMLPSLNTAQNIVPWPILQCHWHRTQRAKEPKQPTFLTVGWIYSGHRSFIGDIWPLAHQNEAIPTLMLLYIRI